MAVEPVVEPPRLATRRLACDRELYVRVDRENGCVLAYGVRPLLRLGEALGTRLVLRDLMTFHAFFEAHLGVAICGRFRINGACHR